MKKKEIIFNKLVAAEGFFVLFYVLFHRPWRCDLLPVRCRDDGALSKLCTIRGAAALLRIDDNGMLPWLGV